MMYAVHDCRYSSSCVASCILYVGMHSGMSVHVSIALRLSFMLGISWSLFSPWICIDSQSDIKSSRLSCL